MGRGAQRSGEGGGRVKGKYPSNFYTSKAIVAKEEWDNGGLYREIIIHIPVSVESIFRTLDNKLSTEWMVFLKIEKIEGNSIYLSEEVYIPKQRVQHSHVEAVEQPPSEFAVVVHKHPSGVKTFSSTDYENINSNNVVSLLWCDGKVTDAVIQGEVQGIPVFFSNIRVEISYPDVDMDKFIKKPEPSAKNYYGTYNYYDYNRWIEPYFSENNIDPEIDDAVYEALRHRGFPDEVDVYEIKKEVETNLGKPVSQEDIKTVLTWYGFE